MTTRTVSGSWQVDHRAVGLQRILIVSDAWAPQVNGVVRTNEAISAALSVLRQAYPEVTFRGCALRTTEDWTA